MLLNYNKSWNIKKLFKVADDDNATKHQKKPEQLAIIRPLTKVLIKLCDLDFYNIYYTLLKFSRLFATWFRRFKQAAETNSLNKEVFWNYYTNSQSKSVQV